MAFSRLIKEYVVLGSPPQRRFFFAMWRFLGTRVNRASIVNVLVFALSWNEFAHALKPEVHEADAKPIVFRTEYMVPVAEQTLGIKAEESGVDREIARMFGPQPIQLGRGKTSPRRGQL